MEAELSGDLGFPDLVCIRNARQILISSPALLAIAVGDFPAAAVRQQASSTGLKAGGYRGIPLWIASGRTLSVAVMNESLVLIGERKTLEAAIDRSMEAGRNYSPLLERAARFSHEDLWVVATQIPDPLASLFVPLEIAARGFDGGISLRDGLRLDAAVDAGSEEGAAAAADEIAKSIPGLPEVARGLQVATNANYVTLTLDVTGDQLAESLRTTASPATHPAPAPAIPAAPLAPPAPPAPTAPIGPQIIHIYGLDDGPREIVLPAVKPPEHK